MEEILWSSAEAKENFSFISDDNIIKGYLLHMPVI